MSRGFSVPSMRKMLAFYRNSDKNDYLCKANIMTVIR